MMRRHVKYFIIEILLFFCQSGICQKNIRDFYKVSNQQFNSGKYVEALNTNLAALKIAESNNDCLDIGYGYMQVGRMYYYLKEKRVSLNTFFIAKKYIDSCGLDSMKHKVYHNIGAMYVELGKGDSALFYLNKTLAILNETKRFTELARINSVIADLHINITLNVKEAEKFVIQAEKFSELSGDPKEKIFAKIKRGGLYRRQNLLNEAFTCYKEALEAYEKMHYTEGRLYMLKSSADILALNKDPRALQYYTKLLALKDSIFKAETAGKIAEYQTLYKTEKKEKENKILQQENSLTQVKLQARNNTIIGLVISILLIIALVAWRISVMNLRKKEKELEASKAIQKEKERISRDLHDNVGGQLSYVLYSIDGINDQDSAKRSEIASSINISVRNVISNLRETIWAISDESISVSDLSDKLKVYARSMFKNTETKLSFSEDIQNDLKLNSLLNLNMYRICQEIINNAFKHSKASELKIDIYCDKQLKLVISDNGIGFENAMNDEGYGMSNISKRAEEVGITIELMSVPGKGTRYSLMV